MEDCDCIIPAAGRSQRMGDWKPVMPFGGSTIIQTVVAAALQACSRVLLVTGFRGAELDALFDADPRIQRLHNPGWEMGMFSSLRIGAASVRTRRFFVTLGDMPWISPEVYRALVSGDDGSEVVFPVHGGRRGHPVLIHERVRPAIQEADPARGSMRLIAQGFSIRELEWPDDSILRDVDAPADLR